MTSKAFRATFSPAMRDDQLGHLRRWAEEHCARAVLFRDEHRAVVLLALRDKCRSGASFARTLRTALRRLAIDVPLRGRWVSLVSAREVLAQHDGGDVAAAQVDARPQDACDLDIKVVLLR